MVRWAKLLLRVVGVLVLVVVLAAAALYGVSAKIIHTHYALPEQTVASTSDSATVARGAHLVQAIGKCGGCHGERLTGQVMVDDPMLGRLYAVNLTPGKGGISGLSDAEIVRAVRQGVGPDGKSLVFMPSPDYGHFSDEDMTAIVSYLRSMAPVDHEEARSHLGPIGRVLVVTQHIPDLLPARSASHEAAAVPPVPEGPTAQYGEYLVRVGGCFGCHGPALKGGPIPGAPPTDPPAANISPEALHGWTEADFARVLREGINPSSRAINTAMPWKFTRYMTDDEIHAVWLYLQSMAGVQGVARS